ncbi:hypothetical protein HDV03_001626 [Kappamyces sp. JEL0829]|nr:hypothetical protein HDV03_001626 [Kappamyces sp. JEL0829]KAJ3363890.1 hypothetical protein HDU91_002824 [Kappamyces sp. JEL0680]
MYLTPDFDDPCVWHGVLFLHRGYWKNAIFKFRMNLGSWPQQPEIRFIQKPFHPLVDETGLVILPAFLFQPSSRSRSLADTLVRLKEIFWEGHVAKVLEKDIQAAGNLPALRLFHNNRMEFVQLAAASAQQSCAPSELYAVSDSSIIQFRELDDDSLQDMKEQLGL